MNGWSGIKRGVFTGGSLWLVVSLLLLAPVIAGAEGLTLVRTATLESSEQVATKMLPKKPISLGLDENGDVMIRFRRVSLTMSYNPADLAPQPREKVAVSLSPEAPAVCGLGIKVGFAF